MEKRKSLYDLLREKPTIAAPILKDTENNPPQLSTLKVKGKKSAIKDASRIYTTKSTFPELKDSMSLGVLKFDLNLNDLERMFSTFIRLAINFKKNIFF